MNGKVLLASLVGAVIFFVWGFIFWGMLGGFGTVTSIPNEDQVAEAVKGNITEAGIYYYPAMDEGGNEEWQAKHEVGPLFMISYHPEGANPMNAQMFMFGFIHFFVSALILCLILNSVLGNLTTFSKRVVFIVGIGLFASVMLDFSQPIWWYSPWSFAFSSLFYNVVGWLLAGLAIAKLLKPQTEASA